MAGERVRVPLSTVVCLACEGDKASANNARRLDDMLVQLRSGGLSNYESFVGREDRKSRNLFGEYQTRQSALGAACRYCMATIISDRSQLEKDTSLWSEPRILLHEEVQELEI